MSEQTYRNPLFGQRVDRYIPPELRQGLGAVLALGDMFNPVSAYREYIRDVGEEDYPSAAANLAGFVAPGAAGAIASRLGRSGIRAIEPYSDDAARALMEMLSPTGAPDVPRGPMEMSRREFLAGLGAAAATPALPVDEMLGGLGRVGARGGVGLSGRLGALAGLRGKSDELDEFLYEPRQLQNALRGALRDASWSPDVLMTRDAAEAKERFVRETEGRLDDFERSYRPMFSELAITEDMIIDGRRDLVSDIARNADAFADELGDLSDDELRGLADQIEDFMNNPTADLPVYNLVKGSEGEDIVGLFERNMGGFADRLEAEAARRGLEDVRLVGLREYLDEFSSDFGSRGVDEFSFVPDDFGVAPRMVGGVEDFGRGLGSSSANLPRVSIEMEDAVAAQNWFAENYPGGALEDFAPSRDEMMAAAKRDGVVAAYDQQFAIRDDEVGPPHRRKSAGNWGMYDLMSAEESLDPAERAAARRVREAEVELQKLRARRIDASNNLSYELSRAFPEYEDVIREDPFVFLQSALSDTRVPRIEERFIPRAPRPD